MLAGRVATLPWMQRPTLTDGVVTLRPGRLSDADALTDACQDPEVQRWSLVLPWPYQREDAVAYVERSFRQAAEGTSINLVIVDASDRLVGSISVFAGEIGYWVAPGARGRGFASRSLILLRDWAHEVLGHDRLTLLIHPDNAASRRVAERAGFADSGERRVPERGREPDPHAVYVWSAA
jgi:RimJ/RimL family protein N-acetyltransferase